uniref:CLN3 protein n=1 Tax=Trepomonas sp. PC1 TaxID=1076344 RepID=A0A146KAB0_9EUKA|eukprot:JAP93760.1 CLN3 protein [Trepomonas sp. PC1]
MSKSKIYKEPAINTVCFIFFGWTNNFGYSVMLSAAKRIIGDKAPTSAVLLCDILPAFLIKLFVGFFLEKIPMIVKVLVTVLCAVLGFLLASLSDVSVVLGLMGVVFHSTGSGIGEITFLSYSSYFSASCLSGWSVGTGLAGLTAAGMYAILSDLLHVNNKIILYCFIPIPLLMIEAYYLSNSKISPGQQAEKQKQSKQSDLENIPLLKQKQQKEKLTMKQKIMSLLPMWTYYLSLFLVYVSEYMINQSVNAVMDFPGSQYETLFYTFSQFAYQGGVLISRSSLQLFKLPYYLVLMPSLFQFLFLVMFSFEAMTLFINNFWVMMCLVFVEGFWGGLVYVDAMYWISMKSEEGIVKEFRLGIAAAFNSLGVLVASLIGFWLEPYIKEHKYW